MCPFVDIHTHRFTGCCIEPRARGIHPWQAADQNVEFAVTDAMFADADAVGETGLDFACGVDRVAQELMNREKLDKDEFVTIMEGGSLSPLDGMPSANPIEGLLKA